MIDEEEGKKLRFGIYATSGVGAIDLAEFQETLDSKMAGARAMNERSATKNAV